MKHRYFMALAIVLTMAASAQEPRRVRKNVPKPALTSQELKLKAVHDKQADELLTRSYGLSPQLSETDHAFLLARMATATAKRDPERSSNWADEVFRISAGLPSSEGRSLAEATAMLALIEGDPEHALAMLPKLDAPKTNSKGQAPFDMRDGVTAMLFQRYWTKKGLEGLTGLLAIAHEMGENGYYPYSAIGMLTRQVERKDRQRAQDLVNDALQFISRHKRSNFENQEVAMFLRQSQSLIPTAMMKEVLEKIINEALATKDASDAGIFATVENDEGNKAEMTSAASFLLFQLMPLVRQTDKEWAAKLEEQHRELREAARMAEQQGDNVRMSMRAGGPGNEAPRDMREEMVSADVNELTLHDPQAALKKIGEIHDPTLRAAAQARIAGEIEASDPARAAALLRSAKEAMAEAKDSRDKLTILTGLAEAQAAMKDPAALGATLERGYRMGEEMFRKGVDQQPEQPAFQQPGYELLARMTRNLMTREPGAVLNKLNDVRTPALQSLLLVSAAEGLDPDAAMPPGIRIEIDD